VRNLKDRYKQKFDNVLEPLAIAIEEQLRDYLRGEPRIDRVSARAKSIDRFLAKAAIEVERKPKYADPLREIQDQLGARIITFYKGDTERVADIVRKYYRPIESKDMVPDHRWKFGYFGTHFILITPKEVIDPSWDKELVPQFFELQIKTLFQHAWSEANHDLGYKPALAPLDANAERKLAFTAAQAWGADHIFSELYAEQVSQQDQPAA
jgi:putative GTP pyrophosphokinase